MNTADYMEANLRRTITVCGSCLLVILWSCGGGERSAIIDANAKALENVVDMSDRKIDADEYLRFDEPTVVLGEIPIGETRKMKIRAKNISDGPLVILDVVTSCGCAKVKWSRKPIPADGSAEMELSFTAETEGVFFKKIAVTHSASPRPVSFTVEGSVTPRKSITR